MCTAILGTESLCKFWHSDPESTFQRRLVDLGTVRRIFPLHHDSIRAHSGGALEQ
jgi:hypothetical protein